MISVCGQTKYMFNRIKNLFLDILFPPHCVACDSEGSFLCKNCASLLHPLPPSCIACGMMTQAKSANGTINIYPAGHTCHRCRKKTFIRVFISPFPYRDVTVRQLIHEFKYRRIRSISPLLGRLIASYMHYYKTSLPKNAIIMPIPLHSRKKRMRGFNQALLLAQDIASHMPLPMAINTQSLIRIAPSTPQTKLTAIHRRANVENIFSLRDPNYVHGKTIILVDDVKTTGATLEQAARVLKKSGAKEIWAITFAH